LKRYPVHLVLLSGMIRKRPALIWQYLTGKTLDSGRERSGHVNRSRTTRHPQTLPAFRKLGPITVCGGIS
jgi:hypothetical protein